MLPAEPVKPVTAAPCTAPVSLSLTEVLSSVAMVSPALVFGGAYPGRSSLHFVPFATSMFIGTIAMVTATLLAARRGTDELRPRTDVRARDGKPPA